MVFETAHERSCCVEFDPPGMLRVDNPQKEGHRASKMLDVYCDREKWSRSLSRDAKRHAKDTQTFMTQRDAQAGNKRRPMEPCSANSFLTPKTHRNLLNPGDRFSS